MMSNKEFFDQTLQTWKMISKHIDLDNLRECDSEIIFEDVRKLTHDLLAAYGYAELRKKGL